MTSARLPGKVLRPLSGRPILEHVLNSLATCDTLDAVVVATSIDTSDGPVVDFCSGLGARCHRGPLDDVASRFLGAAQAEQATAIVRISADSPLLDPALVNRAVRLYQSSPVDLVTNVAPRSFPKGQSVEVIATAALVRAVRAMTTTHEREHVTPFLYDHPGKFTVARFVATVPRPDVQLSVDTAADFARCEAIMSRLGQAPPVAGWEACVRAYDAIEAEASA